jgi:UDP-N-acetylglucosamine:LPS N-acetylglucosamine transferase
VVVVKTRSIKIALVASAGGHLSELLLVKKAWADYDNIYFVSSMEQLKSQLQRMGPVYITGECNRKHPWKVIRVFFKCFRITIEEKPDVIISTGAAPGILSCMCGKFFGAKVVWLDSIANTEKLSMSGRLIRPFADLILSQWEDVASKYPNVEYWGAVM